MSGTTKQASYALVAVIAALAAAGTLATEPATPASGPVTPAAASFRILDPATVRATDTLATLRQRFGNNEVQAGDVPGAEGETVPGWTLHPDDPKWRVYIYLDDAGRHPANLSVTDPESRWRRDDGVRAGMTLTELVKRNGKPIDFFGFDWDYGGQIVDWHGGTLKGDGAIALCPPDFAAGREPKDYPVGEPKFSSSLPVVARFPPIVCAFDVVLLPPGKSSSH